MHGLPLKNVIFRSFSVILDHVFISIKGKLTYHKKLTGKNQEVLAKGMNFLVEP